MPETSDQEAIIAALRAGLTPFHYQWLCACAVYPGLRFPLTVWLGARLAEREGREPPDADAHLPLIRLPWFRDGAIPDVMRLRLLRDLSPENRDLVRRDIEGMFSAARPAGDDPDTHYVLDLKRPPRLTLARLAKRLLTWRRTDARPPEDAIFVRYMLGRVPSALDLEIDRRLAQILGARLAGWFDWRTLLACCAALVLTVVGWEAGTVIEQRWTVDLGTEQITLPQMVRIGEGTFTMGSPPGEQGRYNDEGPERKVAVKSFDIGKYAVTFRDWDACVDDGGCNKASDQGWGRGDRPVINVSWDDAQQYVAWLSRKTGKPYRLLSEAEWEYAARAGTTTAYYWGDDIGKGNANCYGCGSQWDNKQTAPVGSFPPNAFGLYDMAGNVWQWVEDCWHDDYTGAPPVGWPAWTTGDCGRRVVRGGSWHFNPQVLRSANRNGSTTGGRDDNLGFRVGRTLITP